MKVTNEELNTMYKVFIRCMKETGCYCYAKEFPKSSLKHALDMCVVGKDEFVDNLWSKFSHAARYVDAEYYGPRGSLWYLWFILSDEFRKIYFNNFNKEGIRFLLEKEREYFKYSRANTNTKEFLNVLNEFETNIYNKYIKPSFINYDKLYIL